MKPKEKAKELVDKYVKMEYLKDFQGMYLPLAKQCALIAVDEIIYVLDEYIDPVRMYWQEVKKEIQKI